VIALRLSSLFRFSKVAIRNQSYFSKTAALQNIFRISLSGALSVVIVSRVKCKPDFTASIENKLHLPICHLPFNVFTAMLYSVELETAEIWNKGNDKEKL